MRNSQPPKVSSPIVSQVYRMIYNGTMFGVLNQLSQFCFGNPQQIYSTESIKNEQNIEIKKNEIVKTLNEYQAIQPQAYWGDEFCMNFVFGSFIQEALRFVETQMKASMYVKRLIHSPITFLTYFMFCDQYRGKPTYETQQKLLDNMIPLVSVGAGLSALDIIRYNQIKMTEEEYKKMDANKQQNFVRSLRASAIKTQMSKMLWIFTLASAYQGRFCITQTDLIN